MTTMIRTKTKNEIKKRSSSLTFIIVRSVDPSIHKLFNRLINRQMEKKQQKTTTNL